ncbi:unnamed protein product [Didymodactylos carnosus]|uniref:Uncharacterized protein n=1 Tax=Didymodactylos carnosus TaxID=1234261 RepID=A0A814PIG4_9BILA|nr:unnamed protein product [Didymodactylos carnosus]CAF1105874.1 unnamed protein product [Didymodactylos carnosus]CAF3722530.1 unnamed protein product [Didymodactylos carnosus]CAF3870545.1 unnamed protein product [Didymodactylos carnosus]
MTNWLVPPSLPTGNSRRIELAGIDLWIVSHINNVFVYPSELNIDRLMDALGRALSLWPFIAGRFLLFDGDRYIIEMSDNAIPVFLTENTDLVKWPLDSNVLVELTQTPLQPFLDEVEVTKLLGDSNDEPLFRLKLTHLVQSGEWVLGTSWAHVLGDGTACLNFLSTISRLYQQMEPLEPLPVFERRLWREDEDDQSLVPMMKQLSDARSSGEIAKNYMVDQATHDQLNMCFSSEQLAKLRTLAGGNIVTIQDALTAYIILTFNTHCFRNDAQCIILRTNTIINFRGVSESIAPRGLVANAVVMMLSDDFDDALSLSSIAKTIRRLVIRSRDAKFLEPWLATTDRLMRQMVRDDRQINLRQFPNEVMVNSALRYDWAGLVDFGYRDKCRFYTAGTNALYLRVFRLNPVYDGAQWIGRDRGGAEVSFGIQKDMKEKFVSAWQQDVSENFVNVKK